MSAYVALSSSAIQVFNAFLHYRTTHDRDSLFLIFQAMKTAVTDVPIRAVGTE